MASASGRSGRPGNPPGPSTARRIRERLSRGARIDLWFWDGVREYTGTATRVTPEKVEAHLKISQFGSKTIVPTRDVVDGLIRHLTGRGVEFRIGTPHMEARVKGLVTGIGRDRSNDRRLVLQAMFTAPSERNQRILERLAGR